jgi:hypothetical protein
MDLTISFPVGIITFRFAGRSAKRRFLHGEKENSQKQKGTATSPSTRFVERLNTMNPSDLFGVIARTIGFVMLLGALWQIALELLTLVAGRPANVLASLLTGIPALLLGLWFLSGAKSLIAYAYPTQEAA